MATRNDITGDSLTTKSATDSYRNGWDRIFGKKENKEPSRITELTPEQVEAIKGLCDHITKEEK